MFREKVETFLRDTFHQNTMEGIKIVMIKIIPVLMQELYFMRPIQTIQ